MLKKLCLIFKFNLVIIRGYLIPELSHMINANIENSKNQIKYQQYIIYLKSLVEYISDVQEKKIDNAPQRFVNCLIFGYNLTKATEL